MKKDFALTIHIHFNLPLSDTCTLPGIPNANYETCAEGDIIAIGDSCALFCTCGHAFSDENVRLIECTAVGIVVDVNALCRGKIFIVDEIGCFIGQY